MKTWETINETHNVYSYQGFEIQHRIKIINRRALQFLEGFRWIDSDNGNKELITVNASGDTFQEAQKSICKKINDLKKEARTSTH